MKTFPGCECLESIDPGKHFCYSAVSESGALVQLGNYSPFRKSTWKLFSGATSTEHPCVIVIEKPTLYSGHPRPNDVLDLAWSGALVAGALNVRNTKSELYWPERPSEWKAQRAKFKHHRSIWEKVFTPAERELFPADTYDYILAACKTFAAGKKPTYDRIICNYLDAAALNVTALGRCAVGGRVKRRR